LPPGLELPSRAGAITGHAGVAGLALLGVAVDLLVKGHKWAWEIRVTVVDARVALGFGAS